MRLRTRYMLVISLAWMCMAPATMAQQAPCTTCQQPGCGCAGHPQDCGCHKLLQQVPPNPLAPGRPSPPPCCADGFCYPNYTTWGHYATRWRRWPIEAAGPDAGAPRPLGPDLSPYSPPTMEEEDRRAPPPSAPRERVIERGGAPIQGAPAGRPGAPAEGEAAPQTPAGPAEEAPASNDYPFGLPSENIPSVPSLPSAPAVPSTTPQAPPTNDDGLPPLDEPFSDSDAPPRPPFAVPTLERRPAVQSNSQSKSGLPQRQVAPQEDPPPAPPVSLANLTR